MKSSFLRRWWIANTLAFLAGYLLYTPIAHGITGGHGRTLSVSQIVAHSAAMVIAALFVVVAQRAALKGHLNLGWWRVPFVMVTFNAAFWLGSYWPFLPVVDTDILLGFTVLGSFAWIGSFRPGRSWPSVLLAVLSFAVANFVGQATAVTLALGLGMKAEDLQTNHFVHSFYFVTVALVTGCVGGAMSGWFLGRALAPEPSGSAGELAGVGA